MVRSFRPWLLIALLLTSCESDGLVVQPPAGSSPSPKSVSGTPRSESVPLPSHSPSPSHSRSPSRSPISEGRRPNIVYVLTDDLDWNLVRHMPEVQELQKDGVTFTDFFATNSQCCPSRTSIFTGQYPHNSGVFTNTGKDGGLGAFVRNGNEAKSFAPALQKAGYRTGFMGKYMNGYYPGADGNPKRNIPPGWDEWAVAGNAYSNFDYTLNENGEVVEYGHEPKDYLTDVLSRKATSFIGKSAQANQPFMLELATFAPHGPSTPAPRDQAGFPGLAAPRTDAFDHATVNGPKWQRRLAPLTVREKQDFDSKFAKRVCSVQSIDDLIGQLRRTLKAHGVAENTYVVFGSDNGFHMGEHRLRPGKQTAYDTDINVPLVVMGPRVPADEKVSGIAATIDIKPTFLDLAGLRPPATVDGESLTGLMHGHAEKDWRQAVLVEHRHTSPQEGDPDAAPMNTGNAPSYHAMRTADALYVEYAHGEREYYDLDSDPDQLTNQWDDLPSADRRKLHAWLADLKACEGADECRAAARRPS
ncbi:sulfatase [Streptomyces sp. WMMC500]|uniref:sulfatase family protein n=1 Tax=Streptomyces sp. WMMC500 TaxID=3015154 RepID=UPI00248AD587|nr:sulfatase [Streptomyces sp. WMMC500]WBB62009.1 sulfatase [Streptomyces sp. WMMC500]